MIKLTYNAKAASYGIAGEQSYDIKTEINVVEDADLTEAIAAFIKLLKIAGYSVTQETIESAVKDYFESGGYYL